MFVSIETNIEILEVRNFFYMMRASFFCIIWL